MSDDLTTAHARARATVGESVWDKLSEEARDDAINHEMRLLENAASADPVVIPSPGH